MQKLIMGFFLAMLTASLVVGVSDEDDSQESLESTEEPSGEASDEDDTDRCTDSLLPAVKLLAIEDQLSQKLIQNYSFLKVNLTSGEFDIDVVTKKEPQKRILGVVRFWFGQGQLRLTFSPKAGDQSEVSSFSLIAGLLLPKPQIFGEAMSSKGAVSKKAKKWGYSKIEIVDMALSTYQPSEIREITP
jgi:hypothetical protein